MRASRSVRRPAAGPTIAARPTTCGPRRRPTTTATSRSRTCRRSTWTRPGSPSCGAAMPELPGGTPRRATATALGLSAYDAAVLVADPDATRAVRGDARRPTPVLAPKSVANWVTGEYLRLRKAADAGTPVAVVPAELAAIIEAVDDGDALAGQRQGGPGGARRRPATRPPRSSRSAGSARSATPAPSARRSTTSLAANPAAVADYRAGKAQAVGFLVGQVMKATRGQANAALVAGRGPRAARRRRIGRGTRRESGVGPLNLVLWVAGIVLVVVGYTRAQGPVGALPGAQGAGRQRRPLRGVARRRTRCGRADRRFGGDGDPAPRRPGSPGRIAIVGFVLIFLGFLIR